MPINKVDYFGETLIDISDSTISPEKVLKGEIGYDKTGNRIIGIAEQGGGGQEEIDKFVQGFSDIIITNAEFVRTNAFSEFLNLSKVVLNNANEIYESAFYGCSSLETLVIKYSAGPVRLQNANALFQTRIDQGSGYIYFPKSFVEYYKNAPNWDYYQRSIRAIEDYPDIVN